MKKMKKENRKKVSIPIMLPIAIIVGIILLAFYGGKQLITNAARYTRSNVTTTDASDFKYTQLENGTLEITGYSGSEVDIVIPEVIDGKVITSIGESAFSGKWNITSVQIPEVVTNIGKKAFWNCKNLEEINIPKEVTVIEEKILQDTAITSIEIPKGVTSIGAYAFSGTNLTKVKIPDTVTTIGEAAFKSCVYLQEVNIPEGVTLIEKYTFASCAFESIEIPESVTSIGYGAFNLCKALTNIEIPEKVTTIAAHAFGYCDGLTSVVIPNGVTTIEDYAFNNCKNLSQIIIPDSVVEFGTTIYRNGTIYCRSNSKAQEYAIKNSITYVIDDEQPTIGNVAGNPENWTNADVELGVDAKDTISGLWRKAYSFDGGKTWQAEKSKKYTENVEGIVIVVKDNLTNATEYEAIDITKIDKDDPVIFDVTGNTEELIEEPVTLVIDADDATSGLASLPYSFNGGTTWQSSNSKTYTENTSGIEIKVKDKAGNITTHTEKINITNILKVEELKITKSPDNTQYNAYEDFDSDGMIITAVYDNGQEEVTTNYTIKGGKRLTCQNTKIEIQSNQNANIKVEVAISVGHDMQEVSCEQDGKCKVEGCEYVVSEALGHNYENGKCTRCGEDVPKITVTTETYEISGEYITKILHKTTVADIKESLSIANAIEISMLDKNNEPLTENDVVGTGATLVLKSESETKTFKLVVAGDATGDGVSDFKDIVAINRHRLSKKLLLGEYLMAGDVAEDETLDFKDIVKINRFRLNKITELF